MLLLFVGSFLFHVAGTWTIPLIDRDEPRFAEASREMMERNDYVVPFFNNQYRFDKPPLTYWFQAASYRLFGDNDFAARLPSVFAAALAAVLMALWGRRIGPERVGWWAAIMFTLCFQTFLHAKAAVADMWLVLFVTAAHWSGYELLRDRFQTAEAATLQYQPPTANGAAVPSRWWWWIFYLSLALAFMVKGPIGWTPLLAVAAMKFLLPGVKLNQRFVFVPGVLLVLSIVAAWGIPALMRTHGDFFYTGIGKHVVGRSLVGLEGHGAGSIWLYVLMLPFFFVTVFYTFFPWSAALPWLTRRLWKVRDPIDSYLIAGAALVFIVFTVVKTKLPHYTLPAFPLLALLLAKNLRDVNRAPRLIKRTAIVTACVALLALLMAPMLSRLVPSLILMQQASQDLTPEMQFGVIGYKEPSVVWYFRKHVDGWMTDLEQGRSAKPTPAPKWPEIARPGAILATPAPKRITSAEAAARHAAQTKARTLQFMVEPGGRFVIVPTNMVNTLYPTLPEGWTTFRTQGRNTATGKPLDLTLI
ncbi:MAG: glycosyltransferase family 39 protein, partial [Chthoniobacterales bacterium]|nr:glycosyltransferase family 39 protein [Chthoniobacterales bacterium]